MLHYGIDSEELGRSGVDGDSLVLGVLDEGNSGSVLLLDDSPGKELESLELVEDELLELDEVIDELGQRPGDGNTFHSQGVSGCESGTNRKR